MKKTFPICGLLFLLIRPPLLPAEPTPEAASTFSSYSQAVESRLARQHRTPSAFLATRAGDLKPDTRLTIERLTPATGADFSGALLHHWRGTAFAPGAKGADFNRVMRDYNSYPRYFSPQVLQANVVQANQVASVGDRLQVSMRVRQRHVITVVMDTTYDVTFGQLDDQHGYSISQSTRIAEVESPGTPAERTLSPVEDHGFLWRLNTWWTWEERDGGLYLQLETVSLTRSIPRGLGWMIGPFVESIPRESLDFTLRAVRNALLH